MVWSDCRVVLWGTLWCAVLAILCFAFLSCCVVMRYTVLCFFCAALGCAFVGLNNSFLDIPKQWLDQKERGLVNN